MKTLLATLGILVAIGFSALAYTKHDVVQVQKPVSPRVSAISGPEIQSDYLTINGIRYWYYRQPFTQATTTVCSIVSPVATSSLRFGSVQNTISTSTSILVTIVRAANMATSSGVMLSTTTIASNAQGIALATATTTQTSALGPVAQYDRIFPPLSRLNVSFTGGQGNFDVTGNCVTEWVETQ